MAKYEILYIIRPNIEEEAKNALIKGNKAGAKATQFKGAIKL